MSLLMDALRKAEEAKKKAAQEESADESSAASAAERQAVDSAAETSSGESSESKIELSMADMEEVSTRSAVPNLETAIEFEDEEDYVLPTSVGSSSDANTDSVEEYMEQATPDEDKLPANLDDLLKSQESESLEAAEPEPAPDPIPEAQEREEPIVEKKAIDLDDFESSESTESDEVSKDESLSRVESSPPAKDVSPSTPKMRAVERTGSDLPQTKKTSEGRRGRAGSRQTMARNVFAAKKTPLLNRQNVKFVAGGAVILVFGVIAAYFYTTLNSESTFNIPEGSYVTTEYVDAGAPLNEEGESLSAETVGEVETQSVVAIDTPGQAENDSMANNDAASVEVNDLPAVTSVSDSLVDSPAVEIPPVSEPSRSAGNLQPETLSQQASQPTVVAVIEEADPDPEVSRAAVIEENYQSVSASTVSTVTPEPMNLISFTKLQSVEEIDPNVSRAYTAYQQGSLDQAEILYRQTLISDPLQRDALLGLATIAAQKGDTTEALDLYSRLLARNPDDPIARAGLMELLPAGRPSEQEAELKRLLIEHPNVAALSYALGNFLASNQRWAEAQQAYFRALQLAKADAAQSGLVNPDYAFNLAVSLEHLNQSEPAQNYYREALDFSENHPAGFDLIALRNRLASTAGSTNNE